MDKPISSLPNLDEAHKRLFSKAGITRTADIWLYAASDVAKKLKTSVDEVQSAIDAICSEITPVPKKLDPIEATRITALKFTTGDAVLDERLGEGIPVGMITEISGSSAAGKTQLALQLALTVQLPSEQGGLEAGVAYFPTSSPLPVTRLAEIARYHPKLRDLDKTRLTDNIHTCFTPTIPALLTALRTTIHQLFAQIENGKGKGRLKPVRLLVIDSLGSLFQSFDKVNTGTLVERSKLLTEIALLLHQLASSKKAAIVVLNQVADVFQPNNFQEPTSNPHPHSSHSSETHYDVKEAPELIYRDQSVWFNRGVHTTPLPPQEATLGLIWSNQINMRIMLARTRRRLRSPEPELNISIQNKRRKGINGQEIKLKAQLATNQLAPAKGSSLNTGGDSDLDSGEDGPTDQGIVVRSLSVVFSATCTPCSLDFIVAKEGVQMLEAKRISTPPPSRLVTTTLPKPISRIATEASIKSQTPSLSQGFISARLTQVQGALDLTATAGLEEKEQKNGENDGDPRSDPNDGDAEEDEFDLFDEEAWAAYGSELNDMENQVNLDDLAFLADLDDLNDFDDLNEHEAAPESEPESERDLEVLLHQPEGEVMRQSTQEQVKKQDVSLDPGPGPKLTMYSNKDAGTNNSPPKMSTPVPLQQAGTRVDEEEEILETSDVEESFILDI